MINIIDDLLQNEDWNFKEMGDKIILFKGELNHFPEDYIEIEKKSLNEFFVVSEIHRDNKIIKSTTKNKVKACIYAVILYKKMFDNVANLLKVREIRNYAKAGENEKILKCFEEWFNNAIFSIGNENQTKISLIQNEYNADIKFGGVYLAKNINLSRGYVILYNYCEKLNHILSYYEKKISHLKYIVEFDQISKWYILG